jgi:hypothetical protein
MAIDNLLLEGLRLSDDEQADHGGSIKFEILMGHPSPPITARGREGDVRTTAGAL